MRIPRHREPTHLLWTTSAIAIGIAIGVAPFDAHAQNASPAAAQPVVKQDGAKPQKVSQKRRLRPGDLSLATPVGAPGALAFATKAPASALAPAWTGFYAGATFGPTFIKAALTPVTQSVDVFTDTTTTPAVVNTRTTTINQGGNSSGSGWGALVDGHLGYNFRLGGNVVAGVQGEVTLSGAETQTSGATTTLNNLAITRTPPLSPGQIAQRTILTNSTLTDAIGQRWAASALARVGALVDPRDLVYVIGGYTYGDFLWGGRVVGANGATIGGGIEREIAPAWTVRAEYRYTAFEAKDLSRGFNQTNVTNSVPPGQETRTDFFAQATPDHVSGLSQQTLRFGLSHFFGGNAPAAPGAYAMAGLFAPMPAWQGLYSGVSFGPAWTKASTSIAGVTTSSTGAVTNSLSQASGSGRGAQSDVYLGYNFRLDPNVVASLQAEGTIADNQTPVNPTETDVTTAAGATTVSTSVGLLSLQQRWGASALARLGVLADSRDLIYTIGGYTYGNFLWNSHVFGANGATIGAGWEREVAPSWTLKAEYRYTAFATTDISLSTNSASSTTNVTAGGTVTTNSTSSAAARTGHIAGLSEQSLRFGISHYFNSTPGVGDAPRAYAMLTKAKAVPAPMWTGLYGGVSAGLLSLDAQTTTVQPSASATTQTVPGDNISDVVNTVAFFDSSGRQAGATADIFVGYNTAVTAQLIAGVQVEGGLAHASVLQHSTLVSAPSIETFVDTPTGGPATTTVLISNGAGGGGVLGVQSRWTASALAKTGWLVDPHNLVYLIGGWTYGAFSSIDRPFGLNGPTVGAGIEREIAPAWTLRAEYRYAHFQAQDVSLTTSTVTTQTGPGFTVNTTSVLSQTDHISATTHAVRLGIAHYFGSQ